MDVAVKSVTIELVSTTKNQPGVEFPIDKLKITAVIQDVGPVKANQAFTVKYFKNAHVTSVNIPAPTSAGQSWSLVHSDTYIHDRAPQYLFKIYAPFDQCPNQNNEILIDLNDELLHKNGKQDQSDPSIGISQPSTQPTAPILF